MKIKVLVIDDTPEERAAAEQQLGARGDIELTIVNSYHEGCAAIERGGWDVVLTDLMMPYHNGELMPYGFPLAMTANKHGIPVAIVSVGGHHDHPMFWAAEAIHGKVNDNVVVLAGVYCPTVLTGKEIPDYEKVSIDQIKNYALKNWEMSLNILLGKEAVELERRSDWVEPQACGNPD